MKPIKVKKEYLKNYSVSPYNFVSLPKFSITRYSSLEELPCHDSYRDRNGKELLNGVIEYTLVAKTPVMVSRGMGKEEKEAKFFINNRGEFAIPGSTIRGLVRNNAEILSFSNVVCNGNSDEKYSNSEIEDSKFMYREIAGNNALSDMYKKELGIDREKHILKNVTAGYIFKKGPKEYTIKPAKIISNKDHKYYFRIDEMEIRKIIDKDAEKQIKFMYKRELLKREDELKRAKNNTNERNRILKDVENDKYSAYNSEISFNFDNAKNKVTRIGKKDKYSYNGYIVSSRYMIGKRGHFIIPEEDEDIKPIDISYEDILHYKDDLIRTQKMNKKGKTVPGKEFFELPQEIGEQHKKPVFFIKNDGVLHFGFGPYLRIFYRKSVLDGVSENYKNKDGISYADGIFGFANKVFNSKRKEKTSYKTRVSFEDIIAEGKDILDKDSHMKMLLAEPKPTSYNLYLKQDIKSNKRKLNIYDGDFEIRGVKQYWLKDYIELPMEESKNSDMPFYIQPIKEGTNFKGTIQFNNLYEDELGLLLWSLKLNDDCYQNIGLAKSYGFGRVEVQEINLKLENLDEKYTTFSFDFMNDASVDEFIGKYKTNFSRKYLNGKNLEESISVKELMYIKSRIVKSSECNNFRYMEFERNEFRYKNVLPEILQMDDKDLLSRLNYISNNGNNMNTNRNNNRRDDFRNNSYKNNESGQKHFDGKRSNNNSYKNRKSFKNKGLNKDNSRFSDGNSINNSLAEQLKKFYDNK